jgi:uncharacterized protein
MIAVLFGLLCGVALGLTGGGGSILAVPLLVYGLGVDFHQAVTISLLVVGITALTGFIPKIKSGEVEISAGIILAISGMVFAPVGSAIGALINSTTLLIIFSALMMVIGIWSWVRSKVSALNKASKNAACHYLPSGKLHLTSKCKIVLLISGIITGVLTGLFGVGGGFLIVPALIFAAKMPIKKAITTSLLIIFLVSTSGFLSHISTTHINWAMAMYFIIGGAIGMFGALKIKDKLNSAALQKIFSVLLVVLGLAMLAHQLSM